MSTYYRYKADDDEQLITAFENIFGGKEKSKENLLDKRFTKGALAIV